ncbi:uncharacterized protein F4817DRAFT_316247 [Daldinia loculata]|uniref:uncharacterized protein n=1 Tax=Daldinia loculata TaxID=103429 RepID=UPI0020C53D5F|nr:uncharacterized protein F4817DRAFT_316247 [Daldinia loculata]KAI1646843.1 hypothetical protein F4817DRAFT_316247 [Daldinia loculata]
MRNKDLCIKFPCKFSFSFEGAKSYKYCASKPNCKSDGNFFTKGNKPVKRDLELEPEVEQGGYYQLRSGATIYSPSDLEIGSFAVRNVYANQTIDEAEVAHLEARGLFEGDDDEDEEMIKDEVMQKLLMTGNSETALMFRSWLDLFTLQQEDHRLGGDIKELYKNRNLELAGKEFFITKQGWIHSAPVYLVLRDVENPGPDGTQNHRIVARTGISEKSLDMTERIKSLPPCRFQIV